MQRNSVLWTIVSTMHVGDRTVWVDSRKLQNPNLIFILYSSQGYLHFQKKPIIALASALWIGWRRCIVSLF